MRAKTDRDRAGGDPESPAEGDCLPLVADDGHTFRLLLRAPAAPVATLLWLPALGVAARHYLPFAEALAADGIAVFVHEWRGHGSSAQRAGRDSDWGYRTLLQTDLPASVDAIQTRFPGLPAIVGGHSLGAQLAACLLALRPETAQRLWIVASGAPYWRTFPGPRAWLLPLAYRFLTWAADMRGALPGRTLGFGGNEARGVMRDWARTGLSGRLPARAWIATWTPRSPTCASTWMPRCSPTTGWRRGRRSTGCWRKCARPHCAARRWMRAGSAPAPIISAG